MIAYIKLEVSIHDLQEKKVADIVKRVDECLRIEFNSDYKSDLEIEIVEHAGVEE